MEEGLREQIRTLAEANNLDPEALEAALVSGDMPDEMLQAMQAVLGDLDLFGTALDKLGK